MKNIYLLIFCLQIFSNVHAGFRDGPIPVTASEANPIGGGYAKSLLYFDCTNADRKIRKPLIVFEGFDPGYYTEPKDKEGRSGIQFFLDEIENDKLIGQPSQLEILLRGNPNASPLIVQEYDIVYVNWVNGTDYLQNNEKVAKEVIKHVNYLKTLSGSTEPNVIIGRSMGSIIARMALKNMENERTADANKPRHQTRLFISNDGGQQGSNIPQGYQHLANHFKSLYIRTGPLWPWLLRVQPAPLILPPKTLTGTGGLVRQRVVYR